MERKIRGGSGFSDSTSFYLAERLHYYCYYYYYYYYYY